MNRTTRLLVAAALIAAPTVVSLAQLNVAPPTSTAPAPETKPAASTRPSAQSVIENMNADKTGRTTNTIPAPAPATTGPNVTPAMEANAPNEPKAVRLQEREIIQRTGRLVRDEKTSTYVFVSDSDGKQMADPPIALLPCRALSSMEIASDKGNKSAKFKISGEVTEYQGKNYLWVHNVLIIRDLNQGLGN